MPVSFTGQVVDLSKYVDKVPTQYKCDCCGVTKHKSEFGCTSFGLYLCYDCEYMDDGTNVIESLERD